MPADGPNRTKPLTDSYVCVCRHRQLCRVFSLVMKCRLLVKDIRIIFKLTRKKNQGRIMLDQILFQPFMLFIIPNPPFLSDTKLYLQKPPNILTEELKLLHQMINHLKINTSLKGFLPDFVLRLASRE